MTTTEEQSKVHEILKGFSTAMFITKGPSGRPEARPMHVAKVEDESDDVWFFTSRNGTLAKEIADDPIVLLAFQNGDSAFLSLRGSARMVEDPIRVEQLWKEAYRVWFPGGPDDPNVAVVGVKPIDAEYWDNRGAKKLRYMFEAAKAYAKGETPEVPEPQQHGKTSL
jgi:general stress protein 26